MPTSIRDRCAIVGVGQTRMGRLPGFSQFGLLAEAIKSALEDAGLTFKDVDAVLTKSDKVWGLNWQIAQMMGINLSFGNTAYSGGESNASQVQLAAMAIEAGLCETAVCAMVENPWQAERSPSRGGASAERHLGQFGPEFGLFAAGPQIALCARRHMHDYGTTNDQLGTIAVTLRNYAAQNPLAQQQKPITLEDYHNSRYIAEPLHLFDFCQVTDGAAAVVVTSAERARTLKQKPIYLMGFGQGHNTRGLFADDNALEFGSKRSAGRAYQMAGVEPGDIDTAQIYDCFTYTLLVTLEDYGFAPKGDGGPWIQSGALDLHGDLPTNTSGGQLSEGYTQGMLQIVEAVRQLRHAYGPDRQVPGCELAIVSGYGGLMVAHATLILRN